MIDPVARVVDALTAAGCNPRGGPPQWTARCPVTDAHKRGDRNPSLSVGESPAGLALLTCHAGCTTPQIAAALKLTMRELFPPEPPRTPLAGPLGTPKAHYDYTDEHGEILYRITKYVQPDGRKTFRATRPDGLGGWTNGSGNRRVIYHLPQVVAAVTEGRTVVICEGEKDAETAAWMYADVDAATTCNPFGAGKWHADYNEWLGGAHVAIIADDDPVGRLHADNVATHLHGIAAEVTTWLPAAPHKDLSEAWGAGKGRDTLRPLTAPTEAVEVIGDPDPLRALIVDWPEFWTLDHRTEEWAIEPLVPAGRAVALYAPAKTGKSLILLSAIVPATLGRPVWGRTTTPQRALYLDYEMTAGDLRERLELLGYGPDDDLSALAYALIPALPPLDTTDGGERVLELALRHEATIVAVDTFGRAVTGDENDADTTRAFYRHTGGLLKAHGIAVIRLDHAGKDPDKGQRGSSAKNDDVDLVWKLSRTDTGVTLARTHTRLMWVPESITLDMTEDADGVWRFRQIDGRGWVEGTKEAATALDQLAAPVTVRANEAVRLLREAGLQHRRQAVLDAVKWRRTEAERMFAKVGTEGSGTTWEPPQREYSGNHSGTTSQKPTPPGTEPLGNHREPLTEPMGVFPPLYKAEPPQAGTQTEVPYDDDLFATLPTEAP